MTNECTRREAFSRIAVGGLALAVTPSIFAADGTGRAGIGLGLPPLAYAFDALEPHIDALTMEIHHDRHHAGYVKNLTAALSGHPDLAARPLQELLANLDAVPEAIRTAVRNNGGGHANHSLFWSILSPQPSFAPSGTLAEIIGKQFGDLENLKQQISKTAMTTFGSGWAWLSRAPDGALRVESTPNQDSPLMRGNTPLLGIDLSFAHNFCWTSWWRERTMGAWSNNILFLICCAHVRRRLRACLRHSPGRPARIWRACCVKSGR